MGEGNGLQHSKYMLLFHDEHLRVVVTTANMIKTDWHHGEDERQHGGLPLDRTSRSETGRLVKSDRKADAAATGRRCIGVAHHAHQRQPNGDAAHLWRGRGSTWDDASLLGNVCNFSGRQSLCASG